MQPREEHLVHLTRRQFLRKNGLTLGAAALSSLLGDGPASAAVTPVDPLAPKQPHFAPRAKRVIYLHMIGAPSQLDLFDHKPELEKWNGKLCPDEFIKGKRFAFLRGHP